MEHLEAKNIILIGTSAGGIAAVSRLVTRLDQNMDAAVFIVIHVSRDSMTSVILGHIQKQTTLECRIPADGEQIRNRTIYLAPADHHMLLEKNYITINKGPLENHWRPSIDVLFRTAAAAYDTCATGIILTGLLDDGTSGMSAIKRSGGICMVQDPAEAEFSDMPANVLNNMEVDYNVSIDDMGYILADLFSRKECIPGVIPEDVRLEAEITKRMSSKVEDLEKLGTHSPFTCPDCGGTLFNITHDHSNRFRCYTGHSFTEKSLEDAQVKNLEESIWVAIRMMEERKNLLFNMADYDKEKGFSSRDEKLKRAENIKVHIERLKNMLGEIGKNTDVLN